MTVQAETALQSEAARIAREVVDAHPLKERIKGIQVESAEDASGQDALYVWLTITDDQKIAGDTVRGLHEISTAIRDRLLDRAPKPWPYVRFKSAA